VTSRRRSVLAGAGVIGLAGGVGWKLWRDAGGRGAADGASPAVAGVPWTLRFPTPGGGELVMGELLGRPLVLNFWATWCPPCVKEMPELDRFQRDFARHGWRVVGLALDNDAAVREFLQRHPVGYPIALVGFEGVGLVRELGNDRGGLPFTVAFDKGGRARHRKVGETSYAELARWAEAD
jgi:thiol-disulfide isomerase/thioredoxin